MLVDEFDDLLDRRRGVLRIGPSDEEALGLAFEQLQIHRTTRLTVARDEAIEVNARMGYVSGALNIQRRWLVDLLAPLERQHRVALGHRLFGPPVFVVQRQNQVDKFRVWFATRLQL
jgi:hypothetical protein